MGKFKEQAIEEQNNDKDIVEMWKQVAAQYPMLAEFIKEAFESNEEQKVYDLLFALETEQTC